MYRQTAADLATAREHPSSGQLAAYLNRLLASAHNLTYTTRPARLRAVVTFFARDFPRVFRETWPFTAGALLLFASGALVGTLIAGADPGFARYVLGSAMTDTIDRREMWTHSVLAVKPLAASGILTNNLSVSFTAFATGIFGGIGTAYLMLFNGVLMAVIGVACARGGMSLALWSFVAPHGALELPAIWIAGGAGLLLARGVLVPGTLPRRDALAMAGSTATRLLLGVVPLLVLAGAIEGFVSPSEIAPGLKFAVGAALGTLLTAYLMLGGRTGLHHSSLDHNTPRSLISR